MSADLFAEFNKPAAPSQRQPQPDIPSNTNQHQPIQADPFGSLFQNAPDSTNIASFTSQPPPNAHLGQNWHQSQPTAQVLRKQDEDDDGWGDFEVAEPSATNSIGVLSQNSIPSSAPAARISSQAPAAPAFTAPNQQAKALQTAGFGANSGFDDDMFNFPKEPRLKVSANAHDPSVLFDANDFELDEGDEDDTFGDFEDAPSSNIASSGHNFTSNTSGIQKTPSVMPMPSMDLLSLDEPESSAPAPQPSVTQPRPGLRFGALQKDTHPASTKESISFDKSFEEARPKSSKHTVVPQPKKLVPKPPVVDIGEDDWGAWDDKPLANPSIEPMRSNEPTDSWDWGALDVVAAASSNDDVPPPINVPPPSIILSVFSELFGLGEPLFKAVAGQSPEKKKQILSSTKSVEFLQGYLLLASTAAKVIAGRKQRWLRDKILAKSMSISAAGSKGMKLTGVDKTQSAREDREAADVISSWRLYVGKLRSAIAVVNANTTSSLKVPELADAMSVQTVKMVPTAPKPCVICGLKRDERVAKVDVGVEDSFGEWWVDHWGHRSCKNFWIKHEKSLRQR